MLWKLDKINDLGFASTYLLHNSIIVLMYNALRKHLLPMLFIVSFSDMFFTFPVPKENEEQKNIIRGNLKVLSSSIQY